ncbi:MAG: c-type cytochrome [Gammaproteobacteria bacterium]|nr:c-type cytochrome [Gammaproteobacteria bacterium]
MRLRRICLYFCWPLAAIAQSHPVIPDQAEKHELGRAVYNAECYFCHGYSGDAKTLASAYLQPRPRNFKNLSADDLSRERMLRAVQVGRPGTAMPGFSTRLNDLAMDAVVEFIREEFMRNKDSNAHYHSLENGWFPVGGSEATPFARGDIPTDTPWTALSAEQRRGKRLFLSACVSCHDIGRVDDPGPAWRPEAVSYPPGGYAHTVGESDGVPIPYYERHEAPRVLSKLSPQERRGERIFQASCADCHAADGTGRNWVGSFLQPPSPDFSDPQVTSGWSDQRLAQTVREGLPGTAMPAWRHVLSETDILAVVAYVMRAFGPAASVSVERGSNSGS